MSEFLQHVHLVSPVNPSSRHDAVARFGDETLSAVWGRTGVVAVDVKAEGDGATPTGQYRIMKLFFRSDRVTLPELPQFDVEPITPGTGWCDDPDSDRYNCLVPEGMPADHPETFMRDDDRYDIIGVFDHNGAWPYTSPNPSPAEPGRGSAIFIHIWGLKDGQPGPTAGCIAMERNALIALLKRCDSDTRFVLGG